MRTLEQAKKVALHITSAFEGTGYTRLIGDFDDMGWTYGLLGFNWRSESLQPVLLAMHREDAPLFRRCCTVYLPHEGRVRDIADNLLLATRLDGNTAREWALSRSSDGQPFTYWREVFEKLGQQPVFQEVQRRYAEPRFKRAMGYCRTYKLRSVRALALFFDGCVQQGSLKAVTRGRLRVRRALHKPYHERLLEIAVAMSQQARKQYQNDVLSRRLCIVEGKGRVHGQWFELDRHYGLSDDNVEGL